MSYVSPGALALAFRYDPFVWYHSPLGSLGNSYPLMFNRREGRYDPFTFAGSVRSSARLNSRNTLQATDKLVTANGYRWVTGAITDTHNIGRWEPTTRRLLGVFTGGSLLYIVDDPARSGEYVVSNFNDAPTHWDGSSTHDDPMTDGVNSWVYYTEGSYDTTAWTTFYQAFGGGSYPTWGVSPTYMFSISGTWYAAVNGFMDISAGTGITPVPGVITSGGDPVTDGASMFNGGGHIVDTFHYVADITPYVTTYHQIDGPAMQQPRAWQGGYVFLVSKTSDPRYTDSGGVSQPLSAPDLNVIYGFTGSATPMLALSFGAGESLAYKPMCQVHEASDKLYAAFLTRNSAGTAGRIRLFEFTSIGSGGTELQDFSFSYPGTPVLTYLLNPILTSNEDKLVLLCCNNLDSDGDSLGHIYDIATDTWSTFQTGFGGTLNSNMSWAIPFCKPEGIV